MQQQKRTLIIGGAGFIGSHLCTKLLKRGHHVLCLDNFSTGSRENVHHLTAHPYFDVIYHDISFPLYVEVDEIYDVSGTLHMQSRKAACKIVDASTIEICNVYGPRMKSRDLLSNIILKAIKGESITLDAEDKESYSFSYIDNLIQGLIHLMESKESKIHFNSTNHYTLIDWSNEIIELSRSESKIFLKKESALSLPQKTFSSQEKSSLLKTIEYFKQRMHYTSQLM